VYTIHATQKLRDRVRAPVADPIAEPSTELGIDPRFVAAEVEATAAARWTKTASRSIVGMMNEFGFLAEVDRPSPTASGRRSWPRRFRNADR
jgi:hypothetical protein